MTIDTAQSDLLFFTTRFLSGWYRGPAHLARDLERFATTYRIPAHQWPSVRQAVVRSVPRHAGAGDPPPG